MTDEMESMLREALKAQNQRISDVKDTTSETIQIARENQRELAKHGEKIAGIDKTLGEVRESLDVLTRSIAKNGLRFEVSDVRHEHNALRGDFEECRRRERRLVAWAVAVMTPILIAGLLWLIRGIADLLTGAE